MFSPTKEQQLVIDHFDGHALVIAGPGSGKTVTLVAHVKKLVLERGVSPDDIWVMAFNRDIASKLAEKLKAELGDKCAQATTIHGFILHQIHMNGKDLLSEGQVADDLGEYGLEKLLWRPITTRLKTIHRITKTPDGKRLTIDHVRGPLRRALADYWLISKEPPLAADDLFGKFKYELDRFERIYKVVFLDEIPIKFCDALKANPSFRREVAKARIVIDEFQDLNPTEHEILRQFNEVGANFAVFGDDDQAVNDFRRAHADFVIMFQDMYKPTCYPLPRDKRCPAEILELADSFVRGMNRIPKPAGAAPHTGRVDVVSFGDDKSEKLGVLDLVVKYLSLSPRVSFGRSAGDPEVLILCGSTGISPSRSRVTEVIELLRGANIESVTGEQKEDPFDSELGLALKYLLRILVEGPSPLNFAAWLSVANPHLMEVINRLIVDEERKGHMLDFAQAVLACAKSEPTVLQLLSLLDSLKSESRKEDFDPIRLAVLMPQKPNRNAELESIFKRISEVPRSDITDAGQGLNAHFIQKAIQYITTNVRKPDIGRVHVTTYRKAKGLEADFVVVTSVDSSDFCITDQNRRLLYVAATRAKKDLILTFAEKRTGARRFTHGRDDSAKGRPGVSRSPLVPARFRTLEYSQDWLRTWVPI